MHKLVPVQLELKEANAFVAQVHRHHKPVQGHRFSVGCADETGKLRGVAIAGRPVARMLNPKKVLDITRLATDGCANACSFLYALVARIARLLGYEKAQTYILAEEPGTSLKAAGWRKEADVPGEAWTRRGAFDNELRRTDQPNGDKTRWACNFKEKSKSDLRDPNGFRPPSQEAASKLFPET